MAKVKHVKTKVKKKHWVSIHAPKSFNSMHLGDSVVSETDKVQNKSITANLMVLADDPRKQGYSVRFDVTKVKDGKAETQVIGMGMSPAAVKRLIRRNRDKIMDSFVLRVAGGRLIRVKPLIITRTRTSKAAQKEIRLTVREKLRDLYKKMRFDDIVLDIIDMKTQRVLKNLCGKTHPIRSADIKEIVVLPGRRAVTKEMEALMEKEVKEEEERRAQLASVAAAAGVDEEKPKPKKKITKKTEDK